MGLLLLLLVLLLVVLLLVVLLLVVLLLLILLVLLLVLLVLLLLVLQLASQFTNLALEGTGFGIGFLNGSTQSLSVVEESLLFGEEISLFLLKEIDAGLL